MSSAIENPEPNRFVCTGPLARYNADNLAEFSRDRGMTVVVLDPRDIQVGRPLSDLSCRSRALLIDGVNIIIDVIT